MSHPLGINYNPFQEKWPAFHPPSDIGRYNLSEPLHDSHIRPGEISQAVNEDTYFSRPPLFTQAPLHASDAVCQQSLQSTKALDVRRPVGDCEGYSTASLYTEICASVPEPSVQKEHRHELQAPTKTFNTMAKSQPGAFKPRNNLDPSAQSAPRQRQHDLLATTNGNYQSAQNKPTTQSGIPVAHLMQHAYGIEPVKKKPRRYGASDVHSIPDSEPEEVAVVGHRSITSTSSLESGVHEFTPKSLHREDSIVVLDGAYSEFQQVEKTLDPKARSAPDRKRSYPTEDEDIAGLIDPSRGGKNTLGGNLARDERSHLNEVQEVNDVDKKSNGQQNTRGKQMTTTAQNLNLKPSKAVDQFLENAQMNSRRKKSTSSGKQPQTLDREKSLDDKFVRIPDANSEDDVDELQLPLPSVQGQGKQSATPTKLKTALTKPSKATPQDQPSNDIQPTPFRSSKSTMSKKKANSRQRASREYNLLQYSGWKDKNYLDERVLRLEVDAQNGQWTLVTASKSLPLDKNGIRKVYMSDCNGRRAQFQGEPTPGHLTLWHHFVFTDAKTNVDFQHYELGQNPEGAHVTWMDDDYLKSLQEETQRYGVAKGSASAKSTKSPRAKAKTEEARSQANSANTGSTRQRAPGGKVVSAIRTDDFQLEAAASRSYRRGIDDLAFESTDGDALPAKRKLRHNTIAQEKEGQPALSTQRAVKRPARKRYSRDVGLGPPWQKSLVFPRTGVNKATVEFEDLPRLDDGEFLNDNLVAFCLKYAQNKSSSNAERVYVFNTFFYEKLTKDIPKGQKINYEAVKRWTAKAKLFEGGYDHVIVPINEDFHWYAAIICNISRIKKQINVEEDASLEKATHPPEDEAPTEAATNDVSRSEVHNISPDSLLAKSAKGISIDDPKTSNNAESSADKTMGAKRRQGVGKKKRAHDEPVILVLDSLNGQHPNLTRSLKEYLKAEAKDKISSVIEEPLASFERNVPGQENFSDCGLYLVGYISRFLEDPDAFVARAARNELANDEAWGKIKPSRMRHNIRSIVMNEYEEQAKESPQKKRRIFEEQAPTQTPSRPDGETAYQQFTALLTDISDTPLSVDVDIINDSAKLGQDPSANAQKTRSPEEQHALTISDGAPDIVEVTSVEKRAGRPATPGRGKGAAEHSAQVEHEDLSIQACREPSDESPRAAQSALKRKQELEDNVDPDSPRTKSRKTQHDREQAVEMSRLMLQTTASPEASETGHEGRIAEAKESAPVPESKAPPSLDDLIGQIKTCAQFAPENVDEETAKDHRTLKDVHEIVDSEVDEEVEFHGFPDSPDAHGKEDDMTRGKKNLQHKQIDLPDDQGRKAVST